MSQQKNEENFSMTGGNGLYHLQWKSQQIRAKVDRMRVNSDHEVRAEVTFTSYNPASEGHLSQGRLNLSSTTAKKSLVRVLADRVKLPLEVIDVVVEQLAVAVINAYREGSPVVTIEGDIDVKAVDRWLVYPVLNTGHPTIIFGQGASGKSWLAQYVSVLVDAGLSASGLHVEPANVLYLDWETNQQELETRVTMIRKGLGLTGKSNLKYRPMWDGLLSDLETVRSQVLDHDIQLVVIDSIGAACGGSPSEEQTVIPLFNGLRSLGVTSLCIDHINKEGSLFGSSYKFFNGRQVFQVKKDQGTDSSFIDFGLFHEKSSNSSMLKPMGWRISFEGELVKINSKEVADTGLESEMRISDRIKNLLQHGPMHPTEIAEYLEKEQSHIRKELSIGKNRNQFVSLSDGKYALATERKQEEWSDTML